MLRELTRYAAVMLTASYVTGALNFAVNLYGMVDRPKEAYGEYNVYMLVYNVAMAIFTGGINQTIQKMGSQSEEALAGFVKLSYALFAGLLVVSLASGLLVGFGYDWTVGLGLFAVPWVVVIAWARFLIRCRLDAGGEVLLTSAASLGNTILQLGFLSLTPYRGALIYGDLVAYVLVGAMALWLIPRRLGLPLGATLRAPLPSHFLPEVAAFSRPLWLANFVYSGGRWIQGGWTVSRLGEAAMGAWGGLTSIWQLAFRPMDFLAQAALPGLAKEVPERRAGLYEELVRLCLIAFPTIAIAVAAGLPLLLVVTGLDEKYWELKTLTLLLAVMTPIRSLQMVINQYAVVENRPRLSFVAHGAQVVAIAVSIVPLTDWLGLPGVIIAAAIGDGVNGLTYVATMWKTHAAHVRPGFVAASWASLLSVAVLVPAYVYRLHPLAFLLALPCPLVYLAGLYALRILRRSDLEALAGWVRARAARRKPA